MKCATHPDVETNLRCGKCGKPICPRCLVQTPVGARCPDCAKLYKLPTYQVSAKHYLRAVGTALGMAVVCGLVWGLINGFVHFFYLNIILAVVAGYAIGGVVSLAVNHKRSRGLAAIAGIAVVISYLINIFSFGGLPFSPFNIIFDLIALGLGIYVATSRLRWYKGFICIWLVGAYLTPDPSPARNTGKTPQYCWLERGVGKRGGEAPFQ